MAQFIVETPPLSASALEVNGRSLHESHEAIASILRSRLGANHADLLATPKLQSNGAIRWSTPLAGPVVRAADLDVVARQKLEQRRERIVTEIRGLAHQLAAEPGPASQTVARTLELALLKPAGHWLYSVDAKPVSVLWGHLETGAALPPAAALAAAAPPAPSTMASLAASVTAADLAPGLAAPAATAVTAAGPAARTVPRWPFLPWLMLSMVTAAALWGLTQCAAPVDRTLDQQLAQAEARNRDLEAELARQAGPTLRCVADPPMPAASAPAPVPEPEPPASAPAPVLPAPASAPPPAPKASAPAPAVKASAPERKPPPPDPREALEKRIADAGTDCDRLAALLQKEPLLKNGGNGDIRQGILQSMQKNCRDKAIAQARNACPGQRPQELAPEMAIVFDASGSMNFSLDVTDEEIRRSGQAAAFDGALRQLFGLPGANNAALEAVTREPKRITVAREATLSVVRRLPSDMNVGLVMVDDCPAARQIGMYPPAQRSALMNEVERIAPRRGTPLADGIAKAGAMVDGVTREAIVLVVSDGAESCGQNPCAVATALKREKPFLKINVVDITGTGAGNCVAEATGGKVFTANNADELLAMTNKAAHDAMAPANCKP